MKPRSSSRYWVPMLGHAFAVLELFFAPDAELTLAQVTATTGITKTSVYRILHTLESLGYVVRDPAGRYRLGRRLFEAAGQARAGLSVPGVVRAHMTALRDRFGETVNLAVLQGKEVTYVEILEGSHAFRLSSNVGSTAPLHATAVAKAILSTLDDQRVDALLAGHKLKKITPSTITTRQRLKDELQRTRERGYAIDDEEIEPGAVCLAVALPDPGHQALYGLSISGPAHRMRASRTAIALALREVATAVAGAL